MPDYAQYIFRGNTIIKKEKQLCFAKCRNSKDGPKMISLIKTSKHCINKSHVIQCIDWFCENFSALIRFYNLELRVSLVKNWDCSLKVWHSQGKKFYIVGFFQSRIRKKLNCNIIGIFKSIFNIICWCITTKQSENEKFRLYAILLWQTKIKLKMNSFISSLNAATVH